MTTINMRGRGLRGESFADVARRTGLIGDTAVPPGATDAEVLALLTSEFAAIVAAAPYTVLAEVKAAATGNVTVSNPGTAVFDGVTLTNGQRLLLPAQGSGAENGIYQFNGSGSALTRVTDFDQTAEVVQGSYVRVTGGASMAGAWVMVTANPITVGTTAQVWNRFDIDALAVLGRSSGGGSALVGFLQTGAGAVARTAQAKMRESVSIKDFGAVGDGVADDTAAFTAAIAAIDAASGGTLWVPAGTYKVTSAITISSPMKIVGTGIGTIIETTSASADIFTITATSSNPGVEIEAIRFQASVTRTSGQYINSSSANGTKVRRCRIDSGYVAIAATGSASEGFVVEDCEIIGSINTGINITASTGAQGITSSFINNNLITGASVGTQTPTAISVACVGDLTIRENSTLYCSTAVSVAPETGKTVQALDIVDNWFDNGTGNGVAIAPSGGTVRLVSITGNWIASFTLDGIVESGTGTIQKVEIDGNAIGTMGSNGVNLSATILSEAVISGNTIGGCTGSGISIVANLNKFRIINNSIGVTGQFTQNGAWDILLNAGTSTDYIICDNAMTGGVSGSLSDGGSGAVKYIRNNIGYKNHAKGATSVADGGAISHGLVTTPTSIRCTPSMASEFVSVTSLTSSNFTVAVKKHDNSAGTTQTIYWEAEV